MRIRLDGTGAFFGVAAVFAVLGVLALLLVIQQASWVQWWGIKVHGVTVDGQTSYSYHGEKFSIDNPALANRPGRFPTTVWLSRSNPSDPGRAYIDSPANRWLDFSIVMVWFVAAAAVVTYGVVRRLRRW